MHLPILDTSEFVPNPSCYGVRLHGIHLKIITFYNRYDIPYNLKTDTNTQKVRRYKNKYIYNIQEKPHALTKTTA